jgi:hypothetical protein
MGGSCGIFKERRKERKSLFSSTAERGSVRQQGRHSSAQSTVAGAIGFRRRVYFIDVILLSSSSSVNYHCGYSIAR